MAALHISQDDFEDKVLKSKIPVLVDFYAEWCGPCKMAAPVLDELADEYDGKVAIMKLDVDENQSVAGEYGVMSIPTVVMFKDGEEVNRKTGFGGKQGYEEMIGEVVGD